MRRAPSPTARLISFAMNPPSAPGWGALNSERTPWRTAGGKRGQLIYGNACRPCVHGRGERPPWCAYHTDRGKSPALREPAAHEILMFRQED